MTKGNIRIWGPTYYNSIPVDIRDAKTVKSYKNRLGSVMRSLKYTDVGKQFNVQPVS